jgi:hypothetical protein
MHKAFIVLFSTILIFGISLKSDSQTSRGFTYNLHSGWKLDGEILEVGKNHNLFASTGYGVSFNDEGKGFLHQAFWVCASAFDLADKRGSEMGYCTATDVDGDQVWTALASQGPQDGFDVVGTHSIKNGSGKYTGIEGSITHRCTILEKFHQLVCSHVANYRLPLP